MDEVKVVGHLYIKDCLKSLKITFSFDNRYEISSDHKKSIASDFNPIVRMVIDLWLFMNSPP
jgi:hypothetical protein